MDSVAECPPERRRPDGEQSVTVSKIAAALCKAQGEFGPLERTRTVKVKTQSGQEYTFAYAPLDAVLASVRPSLVKNGLSIVSQIRRDCLRTVLLHESGEWLAAEVEIPKFQKAQELGSFLTYARRYSISALLGVAAEEDDDANSADGNVVQNREDRAPRKAPSAEPAQRSRTYKTGDANGKFMAQVRELVRLGGANDTALAPNEDGSAARHALRQKFVSRLKQGDFPTAQEWDAIHAGLEKMIADAMPPA